MTQDTEAQPSSEPAASAPPDPTPSAGARAGKGVLWISAAKILFVLLGFAVQFGLPRVLSDPTEFGLLSAAIAFTVILTNAMTSSMVQTTSKLVAEARDADIGRPIALRHGALALVLATLVLGAADVVGARILGNAALTPLVRLASVVVVSYAIYSTAIGALNGAHAFDRQARLDATFSAVRTVGLLGGGVLFGVALSAMAGFAGAALTMASLGVIVAGLYRAPRGPVPRLAAHLEILLPIALYQLALNGLLQLDIELLVTGTTLEATARGLDTAAAADVAARAAGLYRVGQTLAFVPYQLMTSVTLVLFPLVAHAKSSGDDGEARRTVEAALRFSLLFVVGLLGPLAGAGEGAVRLAFPDTYREAHAVVPILAASQVLFAMGVIHATVLIGRGRLWQTVGIAALALATGLGANAAAWWIAPETLPMATALGTAIGSLVFVTLNALLLRTDLGASVRAPVLARAAAAGAVAVGVGRLLPVGESRLVGLAVLVAAGLAYLAALALLGELGPAERALLARIVGRARGRR